VPDEGETGGGLAQKFPATPIFGELRPIEDGFLMLSSKGVNEDFAQDLSPEERSLILATHSPTQGTVLGAPIQKAAWRSKPSWFVILPPTIVPSRPNKHDHLGIPNTK
jgi:hypothetical protein